MLSKPVQQQRHSLQSFANCRFNSYIDPFCWVLKNCFPWPQLDPACCKPAPFGLVVSLFCNLDSHFPTQTADEKQERGEKKRTQKLLDLSFLGSSQPISLFLEMPAKMAKSVGANALPLWWSFLGNYPVALWLWRARSVFAWDRKNQNLGNKNISFVFQILSASKKFLGWGKEKINILLGSWWFGGDTKPLPPFFWGSEESLA